MRPKLPPLWLMLLGALLPAGVGAGFYAYGGWNDVDVVNGLPQAVKVTIGGVTRLVPSGGKVRIDGVRTGTQLLEASTEGGALVESVLGVIEGYGDAMVYNVAGAAPVVWERIEYSSRSAANRNPTFAVLCGQRLIHYASVDYRFTEPPRSVSVKGGGTVYKTRLTLEAGGLKDCRTYAMQEGKSQLLGPWQELEARLSPATEPEEQASRLLQQGEERAALAVLEAAVSSSSGSVNLERMRQDLRVSAGLQKVALEEARARAQRPGASPTDLYLYSRLLPLGERLAEQARALKQFPDDRWLGWAYATTLKSSGEYAKALAQYERVQPPSDVPGQVGLLRARSEALAHLGRFKEAQALAAAFKSEAEVPLEVLQLREDLELLVAAQEERRVFGNGALTGGVVGGLGLKGPSTGKQLWRTRWVQALTEQQETPLKKSGKQAAGATDDFDLPFLAAGRALVRAAYSSPGAALSQVASADASVLRQLPESITLLLLSEAWRTGNAAAVAKLTPSVGGFNGVPVADVRRFLVDEALGSELPSIGDELLATLWYARGRRLQGAGQSAEAAFRRAGELDVLHRTATRAMAKWPQVFPSSAPAAPVPWAAAD